MAGDLQHAHEAYISHADASTLNDLMHEVTRYAKAVCRKRGIRYADTEEIAQDAALKVWTNLAAYDPTKSSFKTWVHRCTLDHISIARRKVDTTARVIAAHIAPLPAFKEPSPQTLNHVRKIAGDNAELVDLLGVHGDITEAARHLAITPKAAHRRRDLRQAQANDRHKPG